MAALDSNPFWWRGPESHLGIPEWQSAALSRRPTCIFWSMCPYSFALSAIREVPGLGSTSHLSPGSALCRSLYRGSKRTLHFFQTHNLVYWKVFLSMAVEWNGIISKVPSNPNHSWMEWETRQMQWGAGSCLRCRSSPCWLQHWIAMVWGQHYSFAVFTGKQ